MTSSCMVETNATFDCLYLRSKKSESFDRRPPSVDWHSVQSGGRDDAKPHWSRQRFCTHGGMAWSSKGGPESSTRSTRTSPNESCTMLKLSAAPKPPALAP